ncbi:MAG: putative RING-H2 finger protein [Marteilia pararefringens]
MCKRDEEQRTKWTKVMSCTLVGRALASDVTTNKQTTETTETAAPAALLATKVLPEMNSIGEKKQRVVGGDEDREVVEKEKIGESLVGGGSHGRVARPINIISFDEDSQCFRLDQDSLSQIFKQEDVQNLPVSVVAICGAFRKGKSFMMSIMLKYISQKYGPDNHFEWNDSDTLSGFDFKSGSERTTSGVSMWSKPFIITRNDNRKVALLLMDTQGLFDSNTSIRECSSIFALTTLTSSKIIYNLHHQIQEDDLNNLLFFAEYGKFLCTETGLKPFQDLIFMVRDWQWFRDFAFGVNSEYSESILDESKVKNEDMKKTRNLIKQLFTNHVAILLPYPGSEVACSADHNCSIKLLDKLFKQHTESACEYLFDLKNINILNINGSEVTASQLVAYMSKYMDLFSSSELPEPRNLYLVTAEANNIFALNGAIALYSKSMDQVCSIDKPYKLPKVLINHHDVAREQAIVLFKTTKKMGDSAFCKSYQEQLTSDIEEKLAKYLQLNKSKKSFSISSFILKVMFFALILNIVSSFIRLIRLKFIAKIIEKFTYTILLMAVGSSAMKYANLHHEIFEFYEALIEMIYNTFMAFALSYANPNTPMTMMHQNRSLKTD